MPYYYSGKALEALIDHMVYFYPCGRACDTCDMLRDLEAKQYEQERGEFPL